MQYALRVLFTPARLTRVYEVYRGWSPQYRSPHGDMPAPQAARNILSRIRHEAIQRLPDVSEASQKRREIDYSHEA